MTERQAAREPRQCFLCSICGNIFKLRNHPFVICPEPALAPSGHCCSCAVPCSRESGLRNASQSSFYRGQAKHSAAHIISTLSRTSNGISIVVLFRTPFRCRMDLKVRFLGASSITYTKRLRRLQSLDVRSLCPSSSLLACALLTLRQYFP